MRSRRVVIRHPTTKEAVIWIIDNEQWPRACLRAELIERGYHPYGFMTVGDALDSLSRGTSPRPKALILELRGQTLTPEMIEAIENLGVPSILLGGNTELNDPLVANGHRHRVVKRPFSLGMIADLIHESVPINRTGDALHA